MSLKQIFKMGDAGKDQLYDSAEKFAKSLSGVRQHQLRNLLDVVIWTKQSHDCDRSENSVRQAKLGKNRPLSDETRGRLATIRPRIAYMAARARELSELREDLNELLCDREAFKTGNDLTRLYDFVAAIVAYHKLYETQRNR